MIFSTLFNYIHHRIGRAPLQNEGCWEDYRTSELEQRFNRIKLLLFKDPATYFNTSVPPVLSPLAVIQRPHSTLIKSRVEWEENSFPLYVKLFHVKNVSPEEHKTILTRMQTDFEITQFLNKTFNKDQPFTVPKTIAFFPEETALLSQESSGHRFIDVISRLAIGYPRNSELDELAEYAYSIGQWLREFQRLTTTHNSDAQGVLSLVPYVDVRLRNLMASSGLSESNRKVILDFLNHQVEEGSTSEMTICKVHGDFSLSNILVDAKNVTVLDFAMSSIGSCHQDPSYLFQRLENYLSNPLILRSTITLIEKSFLQGYNETFDGQQPLFLAFRVRHMVNYLASLVKPKKASWLTGLYQRSQFNKCFSELMSIVKRNTK